MHKLRMPAVWRHFLNCAWIRWSVMASFGRTGAIILSAPGESKATLAMGHMHIDGLGAAGLRKPWWLGPRWARCAAGLLRACIPQVCFFGMVSTSAMWIATAEARCHERGATAETAHKSSSCGQGPLPLYCLPSKPIQAWRVLRGGAVAR